MKEYPKNFKEIDGNDAKIHKFNNWWKTKRIVKRTKFKSKGSKISSTESNKNVVCILLK